MASRRIPAPRATLPTLPPTRAGELLKKQFEAGQDLLAKPLIGQLDSQSWDQTTRAVLASAFGAPSENVERFEQASPSYPAYLGADEKFWNQYRRDELQAKLAAIQSCISQLEMGVGESAENSDGRSAEEHPYDALAELSNVDALIENEQIREIVLRDIGELKNAIRWAMPKSILLLAGSILEGILVDVLDRNRAIASSCMKRRKFPEDASLQDLVAIAGDAAVVDSPRHLLTPTSLALAKAITDHRDLIHPHAEARGHIQVDDSTARGIVHLLNVIVRDLDAAKARGDIDAYVSK